MKIYLARHGDALNGVDDFSRALSDRGVREVTAVAAALKQKQVQVVRTLHSGRLRAQQTAEILADTLMPASEIDAINCISPEHNPELLADMLATLPSDTLIVGHLPFMGNMVSLLTTGDARRVPEMFEAGTVVCLEQSVDGKWNKLWAVNPSTL